MATTIGAKPCITEYVDNGSTDSHRYFLSRTTIFEMLRDRGYHVHESDLTRSLSEFRLQFGDQPDLKRLRITTSLVSNPNHKITDLLVNITKHDLMPKHEILNAEEKQELLNKYMVESKQLPRMLETDAIARYYGWRKGQVVKITYNSGGIIGTFSTYRSIM